MGIVDAHYLADSYWRHVIKSRSGWPALERRGLFLLPPMTTRNLDESGGGWVRTQRDLREPGSDGHCRRARFGRLLLLSCYGLAQEAEESSDSSLKEIEPPDAPGILPPGAFLLVLCC